MHKNQEYAKVICDSVSPGGRRITSMEVKYWRSIHSEMLTHRMFARNSASSRAIPVSKTFDTVLTSPFIPEFIGGEQKGMQSGDDFSGVRLTQIQTLIVAMRNYCMSRCEEMVDLGVHKSIINRYLEPWSYITVLITATNWKNFFALRVHPAAEKHMQKVASLMKDAYDSSIPKRLAVGDWHRPYIRAEDLKVATIVECDDAYENKLNKISAGRCARLSYLTQDGVRDVEKDVELFHRLTDNNPKHSSPCEHVAQCMPEPNLRYGCFLGWQSLRHTLPDESVQEDIL